MFKIWGRKAKLIEKWAKDIYRQFTKRYEYGL